MSFQDLANNAQQTAAQGLETAKQATEGLVSNPGATLEGGAAAAGQSAQSAVADIKQVVTNPGDILHSTEDTLKHGFESATGAVGSVVKEAEEAVKHGIESIGNMVSGIFGGGKHEEEPKA